MFEPCITAQLQEDRDRIAAIYSGEALPEAPVVQFQAVPMHQFRMPEYFRGSPDAEVAFIGPHALLVPDETPPLYDATGEAYCNYYMRTIPGRVPFQHYSGICGDRPWLSFELPPYQADKDLVLSCMKGEGGRELARRSLDLIWDLLRLTPVRTLVVTGGDSMRWLWPELGLPGKPPSATQGHAQVWGDRPMPGAEGRTMRVVSSFHWGKEVPLFVRKVPGLAALTPREAISRAREMIAEAIHQGVA